MSKKYNIPIVWQSYKRYEVEADNLEDAVVLALKKFFMSPDELYLEDSFEIDEIVYDEYPDENLDINKVYKRL